MGFKWLNFMNERNYDYKQCLCSFLKYDLKIVRGIEK